MSEIFNILHKSHMFTNSQAILYLKLISVQKMQYILYQININESDFNSVLKFYIRNKWKLIINIYLILNQYKTKAYRQPNRYASFI